MEYSVVSEYSGLGIPKEGDDFFRDSIREGKSRVYADDLEIFLKEFTRENVLGITKQGKIFTLEYRLRLGDLVEKVGLRASIAEEKDGPQLIVALTRKRRA